MAQNTDSSLKVIRDLGAEDYAQVLLCEVAGFPAPVLVRIMRPDVSLPPERVEKFIADERGFAAVRHPNVLAVHSTGRMHDGRAFVLSEFAEGAMAPRALAIERIVEIGIAVAGGLAALHSKGLVHGSLTMQSLLWTNEGPKIDVGFSSLRRPPNASATTDVNALAGIMLTLASGEPEKPDFEAALRQVLKTAPGASGLEYALTQLRGKFVSSTRIPSGPRSNHGDTAPTLPLAEPDLTGSVLGNYRIERIIGEGAMGRVYLAKHTRIGREAAIKVLKAEHARNADLVQRFLQEAKAVNAISHEHIVTIDDFGEQPLSDGSQRVFCVMEVLRGRPLTVEMEKGPVGVQRAAKICEQMASALHAAHQVGVVHRDIKPDNIFLHQHAGDPDYVKVLDFGVAKLLKPLGDLPSSGTQAGMIIGTPEYMAPEQALGLPTDLRVDVYAVGLVLYELLGGRKPFAGGSFGERVVQITTLPPPPLPDRTMAGESIPQGLVDVVMKCLAKKPEDRYQSSEALAQALAAFAYSGRTVLAPAAALPSNPSLTPTPMSEGQRPTESEHEVVRPARGGGAKVAVAAVVLLVLALGGYFAMSSSAPEPTPQVAPVAEKAPPVAEPRPAVEAAAVAPPKPEAPRTVSVKLESNPQGARVIREDTRELLGTTPFSATVARSTEKLSVLFQLEGRPPQKREVDVLNDAVLSVDFPPGPRPASPVPDRKPSAPKKGKGPISKDGVINPFD